MHEFNAYAPGAGETKVSNTDEALACRAPSLRVHCGQSAPTKQKRAGWSSDPTADSGVLLPFGDFLPVDLNDLYVCA